MSDDRTIARFVRPIYDAIDGRQYKVAIKLCTNKKVAHMEIVQVLKAHCLERTGKVEEALKIVRAVQTKHPTDDTLLNTMSLVFRLCGCEHEMLPTFEYACAHSEPPNEEIFQSLFVAYARKGDFLKQQQTALKMNKLFGNIKYVCWAALSMLLQVNHAGAPPKMLGLADRLLLKTMRDTKSGDGEALQLVIYILQQQGRHEEALQVFDEFEPHMENAKAAELKAKADDHSHVHGKDCSYHHAPPTAKGRSAEGEGAYEDEIQLGPMQAIDCLALKATLAKTIGNWERSASSYQELLEKYNADDWTYLTQFIRATFMQGIADIGAMEAFLRELPTRKGNEHLRGPWLALVHVQSERLKQTTGYTQPSDKKTIGTMEMALVDQILAYVERFYTKTCCFSDLKQYLDWFMEKDAKVSSAARTRLVQTLQEMATTSVATTKAVEEVDAETSKLALKQLNRRLFSLKALRYLGHTSTETIAKLDKLVESLVKEYETSSWLNLGSKGGQREVQNTDDLLLLAALTLVDLYQREASSAPQSPHRLLYAAALLEYGLDKSAYNFQMKLLLSRLYGYMGAGEAMLGRHRELDIKHIQLDSLSYLVLDKALALGHHVEARRLCESIQRLHATTNHDTPEYMTRAYKYGVYSKVLDTTRFLYEKMKNSHALAIARAGLLQFALEDAMVGGPSEWVESLSGPGFQTAIDEIDAMISTSLSSNQHRDVIVTWSNADVVPTGDSFARDGWPLVECDRSATMSSSRAWLQLQLVVPKLVRGVLTNDSTSEPTALVQEYQQLLTKLNLTTGTDVKAWIWKWSGDVVSIVGTIATAMERQQTETTDWVTIAATLTALQTRLSAIQEGICASLTHSARDTATETAVVSFSSYGVSALTLILRDAGLWAAAALCAVLRAWLKKRPGKKDGGDCVSILRTLLKHIQDLLAALEVHLNVLSVGCNSATIESTTMKENVDLTAAQQKVVENVTRSYTTLQTQLSEQLRTAAGSLKTMLQK